jgi:hypothetical protein
MQSPPLHRLRERHLFHWRHRWTLAPAAIIAAAAAAELVTIRLPAAARLPDSAVAAATLVYFSGVHTRRRVSSLLERPLWPFSERAFLIGVLFTAGCLLPAASQAATGSFLSPGRMAVSGYFAILAWLNCDAIGRWEGVTNPTRRTSVEVRALLVAGGGAVLAIILGPGAGRLTLLAASGALSALLFVLLERMRWRLAPVALRAAADLALLTPALLLLIRT